MQPETMHNGSRRAMAGSIHKIREFELEKVCLVDEFDILQIVGEGWFGKILLVEHRATDTEMVLKALPKPYVSIRDFYREFHYGLHLSAHRNIVTTYDVAFETAGFYVFSQEYAPLGDLTSNMMDTGIGELHTKRVAKQLATALEHLHQRDLVHRDVKLDNILVFKSDFSRVKLCDFGETRRVQASVRRRNEWLPYSPPEVLQTQVDSTYKALIIHDIWQYGIVIFICLTGCLPWQKAALDDPRYVSYLNWYTSSNPLRRQPKLWKMVSSKAQKMFKKFIEPRLDKRSNNFTELSRYLEDRWMAKGYTDRVAGSDIDELCPSMYSFHSDVNEKNIVLKYFKEQGLETTVDRQAKKQRIRDWIQNSIITEENEDEVESHYEPTIFDDESDGELEERVRLHPIERSPKDKLRYADDKHINPRTGEVMVGRPTTDKNQLSYDVQNIEPVAPINAVRKLLKDDSVTDSNKDSDYGSMDTKVTHGSGSSRNDLQQKSQNNSPIRSMNGSIKNNKSPKPSHSQMPCIPNDNFSSFERSSSSGLQGSTSTLQSLTYTARDKIIQNGQPQVISAKSKDFAQIVLNPTDAASGTDSPYTSTLNLVQGQMKISPIGNQQKDNTVNVTVTHLR